MWRAPHVGRRTARPLRSNIGHRPTAKSMWRSWQEEHHEWWPHSHMPIMEDQSGLGMASGFIFTPTQKVEASKSGKYHRVEARRCRSRRMVEYLESSLPMDVISTLRNSRNQAFGGCP